MKLYKKNIIIKTILTLVCILTFSSYSTFASNYHTAKVKDISDRKYQDELYNRLGKAKKSIVVSMYLIKLYSGDKKQGPVVYLLSELSDALDRGVKVDLYLNTKYRTNTPEELYAESEFKSLEEKGAKIHLVDSTGIHHDKLIIIDSRYILEGSHNWSVSALKANNESSTLISSSKLAKEKLKRLENLALEKVRLEQLAKLDYFKGKFKFPPSKAITLKNDLLENKKYFPAMVKGNANRAMDTYLLLLAYSQSYDIQKYGKEFPIFIDELGEYLELPAKWSRSTKRRQTIKVLRTLEKRYKLITITFDYGDEAWVKMTDISGKTFKVNKTFFTPKELIKQQTSTQLVQLIEYLLKQEGTKITDYTQKDLAKRFHIWRGTLRKVMKGLE